MVIYPVRDVTGKAKNSRVKNGDGNLPKKLKFIKTIKNTCKYSHNKATHHHAMIDTDRPSFHEIVLSSQNLFDRI